MIVYLIHCISCIILQILQIYKFKIRCHKSNVETIHYYQQNDAKSEVTDPYEVKESLNTAYKICRNQRSEVKEK